VTRYKEEYKLNPPQGSPQQRPTAGDEKRVRMNIAKKKRVQIFVCCDVLQNETSVSQDIVKGLELKATEQ
jgi:hypothetical protein